MIDDFFAALNRLEMQPTPEEVADALWLATQMTLMTSTPAYEAFVGSGGQAGAEGRPLLAGTEATDPVAKEGRTLSEETTVSDQEGASDAGVLLASGAGDMSMGETGTDGSDAARFPGSLSIRVPGAQALPQALELSRKLRPLMRRIPSRTRALLDEEATAQRIAEERIWVPVLRPAPARWLEVALVLDTGPSMRVWQQTAQELRLLLERQGAFYDVRVWTMDTSVRDRVVLSNAAGGTARRPRELIDPLGRRLILLVTDCVCPAWYGGAAAQLVNDWARTQPITIVQMLPQRLWPQTALKEARMVRVHAPYPGAPSGVLKKRALTRRSKRATLSDVAVPILTLEPEFVTLWSHLIAGKRDVWAPGVILSAQSLPLPEDEPQALSAQQRVDEFQSWASTTAFQLAALLAAAPLRLPIMRLVQKVLMTTSKQVHLAEVFSSGLLQRDRQVEATSDPDSIHYDFLPDVRDALLSAGRLMDTVQVQRIVSEYIRERFGQVLDFQAVLLDPARFAKTPLDPIIQPFAMVTADVLRRLGGPYAVAADRWQTRVERWRRRVARRGATSSRRPTLPGEERGPGVAVLPKDEEARTGSAQPVDAEMQSSPVVAPSEVTLAPVRDYWALLIGINDYADEGFAHLMYCVRDVQASTEILNRQGYRAERMLMLVDSAATRTNILQALEKICRSASVEDLLFLHFSGHGGLVDGQPALVSCDTSLGALSATVVFLTELLALVRRLHGPRLVLVLNTGANDFVRHAAEVVRAEPIQELAFFGALGEEVAALQHGLLTYQVLEGLRSAARVEGRRRLTIYQLQEHVQNGYARWNADHPTAPRSTVAVHVGRIGELPIIEVASEAQAVAKRLLWVDDTPSNNAIERKILEERGVEVAISRSTEKALEHIRTTQYGVIISDMSRQGNPEAGFQLLETLRRSGDTTPFIFYASRRAIERRTEALARGAFGSINKPEELIALVEQVFQDETARTDSTLPRTVDLTKTGAMPPIRNQGQRGTTGAFAALAVFEYYLASHRVLQDLSEQFLYWNCKRQDGAPNVDGTWLEVAFRLLQQDGCCPEAVWPYQSTPMEGNVGQGPPPASAQLQALRFRIPSYRKLTPLSAVELKGELAQGRCIACSILVFNSWFLDAYVMQTGDIPMPLPQEHSSGGQAVCLVGYVDAPANPTEARQSKMEATQETASSSSAEGEGRFLIRNSWGIGWGREGYGTIPYAYAEQYGVEAFTIDADAGTAECEYIHHLPLSEDAKVRVAMLGPIPPQQLWAQILEAPEAFREYLGHDELDILRRSLEEMLGKAAHAPVGSSITAQSSQGQEIPEESVANYQQSIALLHGRTADGVPFRGLGFLINARGDMATCWQVVARAAEIWMRQPDGSSLPYVIADRSETNDIALLRRMAPSDAVTPHASFPSEGFNVSVGDVVTVWGYPVENTPLPRRILCEVVSFTNAGHLVLTGDIRPGDSGGPVLNADGEVIGIVQLHDSERKEQTIALPVAYLLEWMKSADSQTVSDGFLTEQEIKTQVADSPLRLPSEVEASLSRFQHYFQTLGFKAKGGEVKVDVKDKTSLQLATLGYYDGSSNTIVLARDAVDDPDVALREYTHHVLMALLSPEAIDSMSPHIRAIESGLAAYFPCSFNDTPAFKIKGGGWNLAAVHKIANMRVEAGGHTAEGIRVWGSIFWAIRQTIGKDGADRTDKLLLTTWSHLGPADVRQNTPTSFVRRLLETDEQLEGGKYATQIRGIVEDRGVEI